MWLIDRFGIDFGFRNAVAVYWLMAVSQAVSNGLNDT